MNTIMRIINFINAMHCTCARLPSFGTSHFGCLLLSIFGCIHSKFCMHTLDKHLHYSSMIFCFNLFQDGGPSMGHGSSSFSGPFLHFWVYIYCELRTKAYVGRCRAYRTNDWMRGKARYVCAFSAQQVTKIGSTFAQMVACSTASFCFEN